LHPLFFLVFGADHLQGVDVPLVGGVRAYRRRADETSAHLLERREYLAELESLAAVLFGDLWSPEVTFLGLLAQLVDPRVRHRLARREVLAFGGKYHLVHERAHPLGYFRCLLGVVVLHTPPVGRPM